MRRRTTNMRAFCGWRRRTFGRRRRRIWRRSPPIQVTPTMQPITRIFSGAPEEMTRVSPWAPLTTPRTHKPPKKIELELKMTHRLYPRLFVDFYYEIRRRKKKEKRRLRFLFFLWLLWDVGMWEMRGPVLGRARGRTWSIGDPEIFGICLATLFSWWAAYWRSTNRPIESCCFGCWGSHFA